jgi:hypothetical protein
MARTIEELEGRRAEVLEQIEEIGETSGARLPDIAVKWSATHTFDAHP